MSKRTWVLAVTAAVAVGLTLATLINRDWFEAVFRVDPDKHHGTLEWLLAGFVLGITATMLTDTVLRRRKGTAIEREPNSEPVGEGTIVLPESGVIEPSGGADAPSGQSSQK